MAWKLVDKNPERQPLAGKYSDWKEQIAEECHYQCVYCTINEQKWGGIDHYHIDHFRPKSKKEFAILENNICNLFYTCPVCNRFKKDDWPTDPDLSLASYPDPSLTDYNLIFFHNEIDFLLYGNCVSANYILQRLYLNRPQLIYERREATLRKKELQLREEINNLINFVDDTGIYKMAYELVNNLSNHIALRENIRPYRLSEIRKNT